MERAPLFKGTDKEMIMKWNNTFKEYTFDKCLHELIEDQICQNANKPAVRFEEEQISFAVLNSRANQCARYLRSHDTGPDSIVGVLMERSIEMVVALLSILKAGGAYLPLDPTYPDERLMFMLEDAGASIVLTQEKHRELVTGFKGIKFCLDSDWHQLTDETEENLDTITTPDNLAYMIYTSGSTGKPKGCMLPHIAICNRLLWMQEEYQLTVQDRVLQKTPFTFDVSVWEFFWPLLTGACLVVAKPEGHKDSNYLSDIIRKERITTCHFVPSMLRAFINNSNVSKCDTLRQVFTSGEALPFDLMTDFKKKLPIKIHNLYGPTEAAVDVTYWECQERLDKKVPIGRPISNIEIYILDPDRQLVSIGVSGELYISGVGLARGYLNRPELTDEKFVPHPFKPGEKAYRTGDLARYLPDGNIEFLGRIDNQVKLRGFRIELDEIANALREFENITDAAVIVAGDQPLEQYLAAYIVGQDKDKMDSEQLQRGLKEKLPDYMIPSVFMYLDRLPVSHHGKLDLKALPAPVLTRSERKPYIAPRTYTESKLAQIWSEVLKVDTIGIYDDFMELGGHSIAALQVVGKIRKEFIIDFPLRDLFEHRQIDQLALHILSITAEDPDVLSEILLELDGMDNKEAIES